MRCELNNESLQPLYNQLGQIICKSSLNKSLAQNVSLCLGICGNSDAKSGSEILEHIIKPFCVSLRYLKHSPEKYAAFVGMCKVTQLNAQAVVKTFGFLLEAFTLYQDTPPSLFETFKFIVESFKNSAIDDWDQFISAFPNEFRTQVMQKFQI